MPVRPVPSGSPRRIQIVCDGQLAYFRNVILGARQYGFATGRLAFADRWLDHELADLRALVRRDRVEGIVAQIFDGEMERRYAALPVPVVNISNTFPRPVVPTVTQDDVAVGRLAAEHLVACGCGGFGFWGQAGASYSEQRRAGFGAALAARGLAFRAEAFQPGEDARALFRRMVAWLRDLPRPAGLFGVLDTLAQQLARAARALGWRVPEDAAVLGAGDDDFWVEFESVPLSSVKLPARRIGYEAAALLDTMMRRGTRRAPSRFLPVNEIALRKSTDVLHLDDPAVARALRHIREHAAADLYVADVVRAAGISRTALQLRFRAALGRSLMDEVQRTRIARAQTLLAGGELPMSAVAERSGFPNSHRFCVVFRQKTGRTPTVYRRSFRRRETE